MDEFKAGDTAYLIDGEAVYIRGVTSTGFVVSKIYETSGHYDEPPGQEIEDAVHLVNKLYNEPPAPKLHTSIAWMRQERDKVAEQVKKQRDELEQVQQQISAHQAAMKRVGMFQTVIDFLDGKITHVALNPGYGGGLWEVKTIQDFVARKEDEYRESNRYTLRMLSISYEERNKEYNKDEVDPWDLKLTLHDYRDGSGGKDMGFFLCHSYEEARDIAAREMLKAGEAHWAKHKTAPFVTDSLVKIGAEVPVEWVNHMREQRIARAQQDYDKAVLDMKKLEAALADAKAGAEKTEEDMP